MAIEPEMEILLIVNLIAEWSTLLGISVVVCTSLPLHFLLAFVHLAGRTEISEAGLNLVSNSFLVPEEAKNVTVNSQVEGIGSPSLLYYASILQQWDDHFSPT